MEYLVHGIDADGVDGQLDELSEAHWAYMDRFAGHLVARGPTLSPDGEAHTGSVHVIEAADADAARRFAFEEPFAAAGLYSTLTVTPWWNALGGTMWDRTPASPDAASTIVIARWPIRACDAHERAELWRALTRTIAPESVVFGGILLEEDACHSAGVALALDLALPDTEHLVVALDGAFARTRAASRRWCRGGRRA